MTAIRVFYSESQRAVIVSGSRAFYPGSGALSANIDPLDAQKIEVKYLDVETQSGDVKRVLGAIAYTDILTGAALSAGVTPKVVVDYLNREFAKGPDYQMIESPSLSQTQQNIDSNPQTKFSQSLTLVGGKYEIKLSFVAWCTATNRRVVAYINIDGNEVAPRYAKESKDDEDRNWPHRTFTRSFTAGVHTFAMLFGRDGGGGGAFASIQDAVLIIERVGP